VTDRQGIALARLLRDRPNAGRCTIYAKPFELPDGYIRVEIPTYHENVYFECGIAPNGDVSS
jgi:hypothetical protein